MRPRPVIAVALALALAASARPRVVCASPIDPASAAANLSSDRWEVRRAAEAALHSEGVALLEGGADPERARAWEHAIDEVLAHGGHGARESVRRILRRLESQATDDQVERLPRLVRARLDRMLPQLVTERDALSPRDRLGAAAAATAVFGLPAKVRDPELLQIIARTEDPRTLAGAVVASMSDDGHGPTNDDVLDGLVRAYDAAPDRVAHIADYLGPDGSPPIAALELALALAGQSERLGRLRAGIELAGSNDAFDAWLRDGVRRRGLGVLASGTFLARLEGGVARAAIEAQAARRALDAGVPWLARLLAGRALFLDRDHADARAVLVAAYDRLGLAASARRAEGKDPGTATDDPAAKTIEDGLAAGGFSERKLLQREAGRSIAPGLIPCAVVDGMLLHGTAVGRIELVDIPSGASLISESLQDQRPPLAIAVSGKNVVAISSQRRVAWIFRVEGRSLTQTAIVPGQFLDAAAGADGDIWLVDRRRGVYRSRDGAAPQPMPAVKPTGPILGVSLSATDDGHLVVFGNATVTWIDPTSGEERVLVERARIPRRAVAFGRDVLVAWDDHWERIDASGKLVSRGDATQGTPITGIAGDPKPSAAAAAGGAATGSAGTVYVVTPEAVAACDATTGEEQWSETIGGSGNPVVAGDLLVVSAGLGPAPYGDNRVDRTVYVLRTGAATIDPFPIEARAKVAEAAVAAAREGKFDLADAFRDPLAGWFTPRERWAVDMAIAEQRQKHEREAPDDGGK